MNYSLKNVEKFLHPKPQPGLNQNWMSSFLTHTTSFHQVSTKCSFHVILLIYRQTKQKYDLLAVSYIITAGCVKEVKTSQLLYYLYINVTMYLIHFLGTINRALTEFGQNWHKHRRESLSPRIKILQELNELKAQFSWQRFSRYFFFRYTFSSGWNQMTTTNAENL